MNLIHLGELTGGLLNLDATKKNIERPPQSTFFKTCKYVIHVKCFFLFYMNWLSNWSPQAR